jgi:hypothetical protein
MQIYDGRRDRPVPVTTHTVAVVSASRRRSPDYDSMTLRKDGRRDWSLFFCERDVNHHIPTSITIMMIQVKPIPPKRSVLPVVPVVPLPSAASRRKVKRFIIFSPVLFYNLIYYTLFF